MQDVIQTPETALLLLLAGAISLPSVALRRRAVFPLATLALAIAGLRVGSGTPFTLSNEAVAGLPAGFRAVTAGLVLLCIIGAGLVAIAARKQGLWLAPAVAVTAWTAWGLLAASGIGPSLLAAASIVALLALALGIGRLSRTRHWIVQLDRRWLGHPARAPSLARIGVLLLAGSTVSTALGLHLAFVFAGAAGVAWSLWWFSRPTGARWPVIPSILTIVLAAAYVFLSTVAGPEGLSMGGLGDLPISPAAEVLVAALVLLASWLMSGLWPLHRFTPAPLAALAGMIVFARVGLVVAPAGVEHWRALAAPVAMVALWHAGALRWGPGLAVGAAWLALVNAGPTGAGAAEWLLPAALALELLDGERQGESRSRRWWRRLALFAAGWGAFLALEAGLHGEVVYTVLAAAGAVLGLGGNGQAMTPSASRTPAPSV